MDHIKKLQNGNEPIGISENMNLDVTNLDGDMIVEHISISPGGNLLQDKVILNNYVYMYFVLEGDLQFSIKETSYVINMLQNQIWYVEYQNDLTVSYKVFNEFSGLCVALPKYIIESWGNRFELPEWLMPCLDGFYNIKQINFSKSHHRNLFLAKQIVDLEKNTLSNKLARDSFLLLIFSNMIESFGLQNNRSAIDHLIYLINEKPFEDYKLAELAKIIGTNEFYLKQKFKEETGVSIGKYIRDLRMSKALDLVVLNKLTTKEVAYKLGYTDVGYFARLFKAKYGYTPSEI